MRTLLDHPVETTAHTVKVKGGQFGFGFDLHGGDGVPVYMPTFGKIAHVYKDKTRCAGPKVPAPVGSYQFTISEEQIVHGDRKMTGFRLALARIVPVAGLAFEPLRHVEEGTLIGHICGPFLHVAGNQPAKTMIAIGL